MSRLSPASACSPAPSALCPVQRPPSIATLRPHAPHVADRYGDRGGHELAHPGHQRPAHGRGQCNDRGRRARSPAEDYPYVWGGGHATAGVASVGLRGGPGANGRRIGFDCSGSVAAVLAAGGLWPAGGGVPGDLGVIQQLLAEHLIAPGPGRTPTEVTLYDEPGVHIFMNINGRFFGTSDGAGGGSRKGGPGWLDDGAPDAYSRAFRQYHVLPGVLRDSTIYGHTYTLSAVLDRRGRPWATASR